MKKIPAAPATSSRDGGGDFYTEDAYSSTTVSHWTGPQLNWLERVENSDFGSLWFTYSRAIFNDGDHAGKLMGLAALGSDRLIDAATEYFVRPVHGLLDGATTVKNCWPDYEAPPFLSRAVSWADQDAQDIAHAVQHVTNVSGLSLARRVREVTGARHLAISGGVALNAYLNSLIKRTAGFDEVFVPPAVHDGGLSVGSALFALHHVIGIPWPAAEPSDWEFSGLSFSAAETTVAIAEAGLAGEAVERDEAVRIVTKALCDGQIAGWFEGKAEHGPRALGHRSILALPTDAAIRDKINKTVKFREPFRPLAPAVSENAAAKYFDIDWPSPWMLYIVGVTAAGQATAPAVVHYDETARVQTVGPGDPLADIIESVDEATGVPIVLNTSLNVKTPIANDPADALQAFLAAPIDILYLNGFMVRRP